MSCQPEARAWDATAGLKPFRRLRYGLEYASVLAPTTILLDEADFSNSETNLVLQFFFWKLGVTKYFLCFGL
jgi:hypothetical protein